VDLPGRWLSYWQVVIDQQDIYQVITTASVTINYVNVELDTLQEGTINGNLPLDFIPLLALDS
jgi:hypothetical protein